MRSIYRKSESEYYRIMGAKAVVIGFTPSFFDSGYIKTILVTESQLKTLKKLPVCSKKSFLGEYKKVINTTKFLTF
jgi:hypothetical protein